MNSDYQLSIDLAQLENVKRLSKGIQARCPACAEEGGDSSQKNHLVIYPSGAFNCAKFGRDREHNRRIKQLVGIAQTETLSGEQREEWKWQRRREERQKRHREKLANETRAKASIIRELYRWSLADVFYDSPQMIEMELDQDPRHFLRTLYRPEDIVWTGQTWQSGDSHGEGRFRTVEDWVRVDALELGPMVSPATWREGVVSRSAVNVQRQPYTVLDFDELDGKQPETQAEKDALISHALAVTKWLVEVCEAELAAIIHSGNKSLHVWIKTPEPSVLSSLRDMAEAWGIDPGLIAAPEHPARLPSQLHAKSGNRSRVLWLCSPSW